MSMQPFPNFHHFQTHHCITGSLRHIYEFHGYPVSEEMLLGLGAGVGFIYWHTKGTLPFLGGRANIERPGVEGLEKTVGRRTGVQVQSVRTNSAMKAEKRLHALLQAGEAVMLVLDMGYLPYLDFGGEEYHFGYHVVVACGYDPATRDVLIADRDEALHPVSAASLAQARASTYKPFPPQHGWYEFDFQHRQPIEAGEVRMAIREGALGMLEPAITNMGIQGIRKAAQRIAGWHTLLSEKELRAACINTAIMIDARGGTGGGLFRTMYARFLLEAAELTGADSLGTCAQQMQAAGEHWDEAAAVFEQAYRAENAVEQLLKVQPILKQIASEEETIWKALAQAVA